MVTGETLTLKSNAATTGLPVFKWAGTSGGEVRVSTAEGSSGNWSATVGTSGYAPGRYRWQLWDRNSIVDAGGFEILAPLGVDQKSPQDVIGMIDMMLQGVAEDGVKSYHINGRSLDKYSIEELLQLRTFWSNKLTTELAQNGRTSGGRIRWKV